jgi:hypothetical protein
LPIPGADREVIDFADRVFHLEVLKGGMNRLLFRSNRSSVFASRVEILFMNVQYMALGTSLDGLVVRDVGAAEGWNDRVWRIGQRAELRVYEVTSASGEGRVVAGSVTVDESDAGPGDPSRFFMMD